MSNSPGFIVISRKLLSWRWKHRPEMVALWIDLLFRAQWHPSDFEKVKVERGQCVVGYASLKKSTGLTLQTLRTCITRLKSTGEITVRSTNRFSVITILKYSDYQLIPNFNQQAEQQASQLSTNNQLTINQQSTNNIQLINTGNTGNKETKGEEKIPYPYSDSLLLLSKAQVSALLVKFTQMQLDTICSEIEAWAHKTKKSRRRFDEWTDHFAAILAWDRKNLKDGYVWIEKHPQGPGYYRDYIAERVMGGTQ